MTPNDCKMTHESFKPTGQKHPSALWSPLKAKSIPLGASAAAGLLAGGCFAASGQSSSILDAHFVHTATAYHYLKRDFLSLCLQLVKIESSTE